MRQESAAETAEGPSQNINMNVFKLFKGRVAMGLAPGLTEITALRSYFALQAFCCEAGDFGPERDPEIFPWLKIGPFEFCFRLGMDVLFSAFAREASLVRDKSSAKWMPSGTPLPLGSTELQASATAVDTAELLRSHLLAARGCRAGGAAYAKERESRRSASLLFG